MADFALYAAYAVVLLAFADGVRASGYATVPQLRFGGRFMGNCNMDGIYYMDQKSYVMCSHGIAYVMPCAPGSVNSGRQLQELNPGDSLRSTTFCDVNLVDVGFSALVNEQRRLQMAAAGLGGGYGTGGGTAATSSGGYGTGGGTAATSSGGYGTGGSSFGMSSSGYGTGGSSFGMSSSGYGTGGSSFGSGGSSFGMSSGSFGMSGGTGGASIGYGGTSSGAGGTASGFGAYGMSGGGTAIAQPIGTLIVMYRAQNPPPPPPPPPPSQNTGYGSQTMQAMQTMQTMQAMPRLISIVRPAVSSSMNFQD